MAAGETDLPEANFPAEGPWSYQQAADPEFWPDPAD